MGNRVQYELDQKPHPPSLGNETHRAVRDTDAFGAVCSGPFLEGLLDFWSSTEITKVLLSASPAELRGDTLLAGLAP